MKLKYLFSVVLSSALLFAGCTQEGPTGSYDNISLSKTYVSIPEAGGSTSVTLTATEDWAFVITNADGESTIPDWLTISPLVGGEGETEITFTAETSAGGRESDFSIVAGNHTQKVIVRQGSLEAVKATVADVIAGPESKSYMVEGTVADIYNTTYGNWYLVDDTGRLTIYGTLDKDGKTKNFESLGIENGDYVVVSGPKTTYGTTVELVDVTVHKIVKALVKVISEEPTLNKEGETFKVKVAHKGKGCYVDIPQGLDWVAYKSAEFTEGVPSKINPNPADTTVFTFEALANNGGLREGLVTFKSGSSSVDFKVSQEGSIVDATAEEINTAPDGTALYRLTGYVKSITNTTYGNLYIEDATGSVLVYGTLDKDGQTKNFSSLGIAEGDIITVVGPKSSFNKTPQLKDVSVESIKKVTVATIEKFLEASVASDVYYRLTGTATNVRSGDVYGNFDLVDATGSVYVYGLLSGWGGPKQQFASLGIKEGDTVTLVGVRAEYGGKAQVGSAFHVSHTSPAE